MRGNKLVQGGGTMGDVIDIKKQDKEALRWILNYRDLRKAYFDSITAFNTLGAVVNSGMPKGTGTSNPAANKAINLLDMECQRNWIMVIEAMERTLSDKSKKYLELRRDANIQIYKKSKPGKPKWVDFVQAEYALWYVEEYRRSIEPPTRKTMCLWMNNIVNITVRIAIKKGCL